MAANRRGATIVALGLLLLPMLLLTTLFLDLGKIYVLRNEAQIAADAAALAGGSGFIEGEGEEGPVVSRVHQYVNDNPVAGEKAAVDSIIIDVGSSSVHVVLGYHTGPLIVSESGLRLQARAGAELIDTAESATTESAGPWIEPGEAAPTKKLQLIQ
jgi:uncharacterized membrane protein